MNRNKNPINPEDTFDEEAFDVDIISIADCTIIIYKIYLK